MLRKYDCTEVQVVRLSQHNSARFSLRSERATLPFASEQFLFAWGSDSRNDPLGVRRRCANT
jgi:hypothetical protein